MATDLATAERKKRRRRRLVLLALLLLPFVVGIGVLVFLRSDAGSQWLRAQVLDAAKGAIAGKLEVGAITLEGRHVVLTKLRLYTPEGELVASIERVEADVDLRALTNEKLKLSDVKVDEPQLFLREEENGWNLSRAIASKSATTAKVEKQAKNGWVVEVDDFMLSSGLIEVHQSARDVVARALALKGNVLVALDPLTVNGALEGGAKLTSPLEEELIIKTEAPAGQRAVVSVTLGGSLVKASFDDSAKQLTLEQLTLAPREVAAFVQGWPLKPTVLAHGTLGLTQSTVDVSVGRARATVSARYRLSANAKVPTGGGSPGGIDALELDATEVDLQELVGAQLPSVFTAHLTGKLDDWRTETLSGHLEGTASWLAKGERLLDAKLDVNATSGALELKKFSATGSGLVLSARGTTTRTTVDLFGTVELKELSKLDAALRTFADVDVGGLDGTGKVQLMVNGPLAHPALTVIGKLQRLRVEELQAEQIALNVEVPDVSKPLHADVLLHSQRVRYGERVFDEVTLEFLTRGREIDLDFTTKGMGDLQAHVVGTLDADRSGALLSATDLKWSGAEWSMDPAPSGTRLRWGDVFELEPLALRDGNRRLSVRVKKTATSLDGEFHATQLDLTKLPSALAPPSWELGGTVTSAEVLLSGTAAKPIVAVKASVVDGKVWAVTGLKLDGDASWNDGRLAGKLDVESDVGHLDGDFDVPLIGLRDEKPLPARAHFTLKDVQSSFLETKFARTLPFSGLLSGTLDLTGTGERPNVVATVTAPELELAAASKDPKKPLVLTDTALEVRSLDDGTLGVTLDTTTLGGKHHVVATAPLTPTSLRKNERTREDWLSLPFTLDFDVKDVALLEALELRGETDDELKGTLSVAGQLSGTPRAPTGHVAFKLNELTLPPLRNVDFTMDVTADDSRTRFSGQGFVPTSAEKTKALEFNFNVGAAPQQALGAFLAPGGNTDAVVAALKDTRLDALVTVVPFDVTELMKRAEERDARAVLPGGTAAAQLEASGTLEAPTARLTGAVTGLRFEKAVLGSARFDVRINPTEQTMTVALGGQGRDDFKAKGSTGLDLRLSALEHGLQWRAAPVQVSLESRKFDLSFLSGATDTLRTAGGRLELTGEIKGKLGAPRFVGDASLTQGRLALAGNGDYRDIELLVHATNDLFDLKKLTLTSGVGKASLTARAERQPTGTFHLISAGNAERLPLVNDDQLLASLTLDYSLDGELHEGDIELRTVTIPHAEVLLPEVKRKDLQDLQRPKDIIVLRRGKRATKRQRDDVREANQAQAAETTTFSAVFDAPRNLWVRSSDVNVELGLSDGFRLDRDARGLRLSGEARVLNGTLHVIGREFTAQKGSTARFAGPPTQPYVNVTALHVNAREDVKITVSVAGKGTDVSIKATSEPPLPESDIYAILATGRRTLKNSGGAAITPGQAASVVGQLAASQLKTVIAKKVPIDVFNFETSDNFDKVKLDVGKYIGDSVYVGATVNIGARRDRGENAFAGRLELQMSRSVSLEAYAGDALSFGADAVWSQDF